MCIRDSNTAKDNIGAKTGEYWSIDLEENYGKSMEFIPVCTREMWEYGQSIKINNAETYTFMEQYPVTKANTHQPVAVVDKNNPAVTHLYKRVIQALIVPFLDGELAPTAYMFVFKGLGCQTGKKLNTFIYLRLGKQNKSPWNNVLTLSTKEKVHKEGTFLIPALKVGRETTKGEREEAKEYLDLAI